MESASRGGGKIVLTLRTIRFLSQGQLLGHHDINGRSIEKSHRHGENLTKRKTPYLEFRRVIRVPHVSCCDGIGLLRAESRIGPNGAG